MRIELHIERVLLDGLPVTAAQLPALRDALEQRLGELLATQPGGLRALVAARPAAGGRGAPASGENPGRPTMPHLNLRAGMSAGVVGHHIARAIHGRLGGAR